MNTRNIICVYIRVYIHGEKESAKEREGEIERERESDISIYIYIERERERHDLLYNRFPQVIARYVDCMHAFVIYIRTR